MARNETAQNGMETILNVFERRCAQFPFKLWQKMTKPNGSVLNVIGTGFFITHTVGMVQKGGRQDWDGRMHVAMAMSFKPYQSTGTRAVYCLGHYMVWYGNIGYVPVDW